MEIGARKHNLLGIAILDYLGIDEWLCSSHLSHSLLYFIFHDCLFGTICYLFDSFNEKKSCLFKTFNNQLSC